MPGLVRLGAAILCVLAALPLVAAFGDDGGGNLAEGGAFDSPDFVPGDGFGTLWGTNWDGRDELGDPNSGSALLHHDVQTRSLFGHQCIPLVEGRGRYSFSAAVFIPAAQSTKGGGYLAVHWFIDPGCLQHLSYQPGVATASGIATWTVLNETFIAPAAARSAQINLTAFNDAADESGNPTPPFDVLFDNVYFGKWDASPRFELTYRAVPMIAAGE